MDTLRRDLYFACRQLRRDPGFAAVAVVTLALGIGANVAIFSVVNAVLLRPLPFPQPEQLVGIYHVSEGKRAVMSPPNFLDVSHRTRTLASATAVSTSGMVLTGVSEPVRLDGAEVTGTFFDVLGVHPLFGRVFSEADDQPGKTDRRGARLRAVEGTLRQRSWRDRPTRRHRRRGAHRCRRHA
jgi:hypothetical protein